MAAASRFLKNVRTIEDLPLVKHFLRTLILSAEPTLFRYDIGVGADKGDHWLDHPVHVAAIQQWWARQWSQRWPGHCVPPLWFAAYANTVSRPVWATNFLAQRAYEQGIEYIYRVNDDTELLINNWSSTFVRELQHFRPIAGLGVTGPYDPVHKGKLLTHSFSGRRHMEAMGSLFSFALPNAYSDDWIMRLYAPPWNGTEWHMMSVVANTSIKHVILRTRYEVHGSEDDHVQQQLVIDRDILRIYIKKNV